jgi:hypothetical protein
MIAFLLSNACISNIEVYISNIKVEKGYQCFAGVPPLYYIITRKSIVDSFDTIVSEIEQKFMVGNNQ